MKSQRMHSRQDEIRVAAKARRKEILSDLQGYFDNSGLTFEDFEKNSSGDLFREGIKFKMRIGLHLGQPTQAIMARAKFLKMRRLPQYAKGYSLVPLNVTRPNLARYGGGWRPRRHYISGLTGLISATNQSLARNIANTITKGNPMLARLTKK